MEIREQRRACRCPYLRKTPRLCSHSDCLRKEIDALNRMPGTPRHHRPEKSPPETSDREPDVLTANADTVPEPELVTKAKPAVVPCVMLPHPFSGPGLPARRLSARTGWRRSTTAGVEDGERAAVQRAYGFQSPIISLYGVDQRPPRTKPADALFPERAMDRIRQVL